MPTADAPTFYFDLGSPYAYLAAERLPALLGEEVRWQPISLGGLFKANGRSSWALAGPASRAQGIAEVERRAREHGLPAVRWPDPWPSNYLFAMRVATFARAAGEGVRFAHQAFRDAFQRGHDLALPKQVLASAARARLDPAAARAATDDPRIKQSLRAATEAAHARGVIGVPTLALGGELLFGDDRLDQAAGAPRRRPSNS
ncbi:MAG TPA: 2-hydroxychromene-2-carboxylate isomerase [Solirubrobacteraceae bacterium]|jgi:2-hydroxychromene-2-carboxylate isomerase|nr:2-hydroxychromene-2-carboxylate isomerase [Solirubrobacteraceae bacterium]